MADRRRHPDQLDLFDEPQPPDAAARRLVAEALDETLFVNAGAGSGKTRTLVERIVNLVHSGVPITEIAAVTFTEKAAAELRHRIRGALSATRPSPLTAAALADLDHAPIGTLHAFARRLLAEFPVESGLPPHFDVLDEVQSAIAFEERFTDFVEALLDDPAAIRLVELCEHDRFGLDRGVRRMAADFEDNWDLVVDRVAAELPPRTDLDRATLLDGCAAIGERAGDVPPDDRQGPMVAAIAGCGARLAADTTLGDVLDVLGELAAVKPSRCGNQGNWRKHGAPAGALEQLREAEQALADLAAGQLGALAEERRLTLGALLRRLTLDAVAERRSAGRLEFHDLLVLARQLLAEHQHVRRAVHRRYTRLLLDEFQDTDPIQLDLAVRITADPDDQPVDWRELRPLPGRLCVVGDAKQSIYRFRRADIAQFLGAERQLDAAPATLAANFRSTPAVIDWVNHTMGQLIRFDDGIQPAYDPLIASRTVAAHPGSVHVLGAAAHTEALNADDLRAREAADVADIVVRAVADGWQVARRRADGTSELADCRLADITILLPARTSLPALQVALAERDIPYRAENSSLVYAAPEIRALLLALRGADDPTDELAIVAALRTPLYGCSDRDLFDWRVTQGRGWNPAEAIPVDLAEHPVGAGLASIGALAERIPWSTPSELLAALVDERAVLEVALATPHGRDMWRRVRFVIDQARAWSEAGGHGVRRYLTWTRLQGDDGRFVAETVLPETDHDAVRIMTVHASKGLEFPVTIVSGMTTKPQGSRARRVVWPPGTWTLAAKDDPIYESFKPVDELMDSSERQRLLYVAATRAQDHLVVSLHRKATTGTDNTSAAWLAEASTGAAHVEHVGAGGRLTRVDAAAAELPWADEEAWAARRQEALDIASRPRVLSATAVAHGDDDGDPGLRKEAVDLDQPAWRQGRAGTAVGRAVHAVLQHVDLTDAGHGEVLDLAAAQAAAEGVPALASTIAALARSALAAPIVAAAARHEHWRELFVGTAVGDRVIEGYIDLLVRVPGRGLVVVDHKTDHFGDDVDRDTRLTRYGRQLAAYGVALAELLDEPVAAGVLVLCRVDGPAEEVEVTDWAALKEAVRAELAVL